MSRWNTSAKAVIRKDMFKVAKQFSKRSKTPTVSKCAFMVPAEDCLCVKAAMKDGRINQDTFIVAIEQESETVGKIEDSLRSLGIKRFDIMNRSFLTLSKRFIRNVAAKVPEIDFMYLDFCGTYCPSILKSFRMMVDHYMIAESAPIAYTAQLTDRNLMWGNYYNRNRPYYRFCDMEEQQRRAESLTDHFLDRICDDFMGEKYAVTYGRVYKNSLHASPMITFMTQPQKRLRVIKEESGSRNSYNMGYVGY